MEIRVIISGSRDFSDFDLLEKECRKIFRQLSIEGVLTGERKKDAPNMEIISGGASGADKLGEKFAKKYNIKTRAFPAEWNKHRGFAGFIRNGIMANYLLERDKSNRFLIAFWDGESKGTKHIINTARSTGIKTFVIMYKETLDSKSES